MSNPRVLKILERFAPPATGGAIVWVSDLLHREDACNGVVDYSNSYNERARIIRAMAEQLSIHKGTIEDHLAALHEGLPPKDAKCPKCGSNTVILAGRAEDPPEWMCGDCLHTWEPSMAEQTGNTTSANVAKALQSYDHLKQKLQEDASTGLDLSPGDPAAIRALEALKLLEEQTVKREREKFDEELKALLELCSPPATIVRCCEGGGPESLIGTVSLTLGRLVHDYKELKLKVEELQQPMDRNTWRLILENTLKTSPINPVDQSGVPIDIETAANYLAERIAPPRLEQYEQRISARTVEDLCNRLSAVEQRLDRVSRQTMPIGDGG